MGSTKKILILTIVLIVFCLKMANAQQNYYDPNNPLGPNYNPNNTTQIRNDTIDATDTTKKVKEKYDFWHSPHVATLASAILPGLGQAYNKKYWKIPIIWGVLGTMGYFLVTNQYKYQDYRHAYNILRNYNKDGVLLQPENNIFNRQKSWDSLAIQTDIVGTRNDLRDLKYDFSTKTDSAYVDSQVAYARDNSRRLRDYMVVFGLLCYVLNMADAAVDANFAKFDVSDNLSMKFSPSFMTDYGQPQLGMSLKLCFEEKKSLKNLLKNN